jgi:cell division control protein 7
MQKLKDRLPTLGTFLGEPSLGFSTAVTLAPNIAKITMLCLQPKLDQPLRGDDGTVIGNMSLALVPTGFSDCPCSVNLPPLDAEKSKCTNVEVDGKSNKISESEQVSLLNCRVEDSDDIDIQKESVLPMASHDVLVGESKNGADEDLNLVCKNHGSLINHNTKTADSIEAFDMILNQADGLQYNCLNDGHHQNASSCVQEKNPLGASAYAEVFTDKTTQILFQPSMDNKAGSMAPQMNRNVQSETLPQETTRQDGMNMKNLNILYENRDIRYLNHGEQSLNKAEVNVSKNGRDKLAVKQKEKCKKNEQPKEDKDHTAKTQKVSFTDYFMISNFLYASLMSCTYPNLVYKILFIDIFYVICCHSAAIVFRVM